MGASEGIDLVMRAICEEGDEILIPDPGYVSYIPCVQLSGGTPVPVRCVQENGFILTPEAIEAVVTPKTKAIVLPYPNNPTGGIMTKEQLEAIVTGHKKTRSSRHFRRDLCRTDLWRQHVSVASLPGMRERTVVINGFSKAFAMTGWRIGFVCCRPRSTPPF